MQECGVFPVSLVGTDGAFLGGGLWDKVNGGQMAALTARERELEDLERAQQEQLQSLARLVHELRSPAAASKSMVATFRYLRPDDTQVDKFLAKIEGRMDHLLDLVDDILELSQAKAGQPLGEVVPLDLVEATRAVCNSYLEEAAAKKLAVDVELPASALRVQMPEKAYHLIVSNLVSNAIKYTPAGSVRVTLRRQRAEAELTVQDTGIGIPQDEVPYLFTEFFRASNARAGSVPGTGLGLAAVKALVEDCQGQVTLQSEENQGSTFTVHLPLCEADAQQGLEAPLLGASACRGQAATVGALQ